MNTTDVGIRTEGKVLAALLHQGKRVLLPFGAGARYDLAYDESGILIRVQCKTAALRRGCLNFNTCSLGRKGEMYDYRGDADLFGVYSPDLDSVYLVPVGDVPKYKALLRVDPPQNNWSNEAANLRWASKYRVL